MRIARVAAAAAVLLALSSTSFAAGPAAGKPAAATRDPRKEQKVRELLKLLGVQDLGNQMIDAMLAQMNEAGANLPPGFASKFRELAQKDSIVERVIPVYVDNLTDADIDAMLVFYKSPAGQDYIKAQPILLQQSMRIGQAWGQKLAEETKAELDKQGGGK